VVDIRQFTAIPVPFVIRSKIVQWRSEQRVQVQSYVNRTELASELKNLQRNFFTFVKQHILPKRNLLGENC